MDILPNLIGEAEFKLFTEKDYKALSGVLNDTLAKHVKIYLNDPTSDKDIVKAIEDNIGNVLNYLTFHYVLMDKGILDLIGRLSPQNLLSSNADFKEIKDKLEFLEKNIGSLRTTIDPRTKAAYDAFISSIKDVLQRQRELGLKPTYDDIVERIEVNKFIFYIPNDKGHTTGAGIVSARRRDWTTCLRGLEYKEYCDNRNINYLKRRLF